MAAIIRTRARHRKTVHRQMTAGGAGNLICLGETGVGPSILDLPKPVLSAILRFIGNSSQQKSGLQTRAHWSPVNSKRMHDNRSEHIIMVNTGPLYLKLDAYQTS